MQFLAGTWQTEAVNAPGDPAGQPPNVYDEADAVYSGAHYLHDLGMTASPSSWQGAIFGYNHSLAYVEQVLARASAYYTQGLATQSTGGSGLPVTRTRPIKVPTASGDPPRPAMIAQGQPAFVAASVFSDATGAWGDNLALISSRSTRQRRADGHGLLLSPAEQYLPERSERRPSSVTGVHANWV
jgi:hypothetical protein